MKHYAIKLEPSPGCQQLFVFEVNHIGQLVRIRMVIVHNGLESKVILNTLALVEEFDTHEVVNTSQMNLITDIFAGMTDTDDLISVDQEEPPDVDLIAAADFAAAIHSTDYDDIISSIINDKTQDRRS